MAGFWQNPVVGSGSLFKPTFLLYVLLVASSFVLARGWSIAQLAGLTACLTAAVQLWKTNATGSYVEWYLPLLIVAVLLSARDPNRDAGDSIVAPEAAA